MSKRDLTKSMDTLFPQLDDSECRVCGRSVVDGRWSYCSTRCRDIANAVQDMFLWPRVRDRVLERDDHTCQRCGLSRARWLLARGHVRDRIEERNPHDPQEDWDAWHEKQERLWGRYDVPSPNGGFHVDHIERIADDGHPFDESNLQTLCKYCHWEKTAAENTGRQRPDAELTLADYLQQ